jgi:hypothetical protein
MALAFKVSPAFQFRGVEGEQPRPEQVSFPRPIKPNTEAFVALQSFSFDFHTPHAGDPTPSLDKVRVSAEAVDVDGNDVTVKLTVNFAGRPGIEPEYNADVTVLVIADLV